MGRFLLIKTGYAFTDYLYWGLRHAGHSVDVYDFHKSANIRLFTSTSYDAVIDFDSNLPSQKMSDGSLVLNCIQGPFFNYLLRHPLYYHTQLAAPVSQNVICIDRKHAAYIQNYYPEVSSVCFMPLPLIPVEESDIRSISCRSVDIYFPGSYEDDTSMQRRLSEMNPETRRDLFEIIGFMQADTSLTVEEAMQRFLENRGKTMQNRMFRQFMNYYQLADSYISSWARDRIVRTILNAGLPLTVCGRGWGRLRRFGSDSPYGNLTILHDMTYTESMNLAYNARIMLNINPWLKDGIHDRVMNAMGHGAVSCSDETPILNEWFEGSFLGYRIDRLEYLPDILGNALGNNAKLQEMADSAYTSVKDSMTWARAAEWFAGVAE